MAVLMGPRIVPINEAVVATVRQFSKLREVSLQQVVRILAWILAVTIVVLSLVPSELRPETGVPHILEHFLIFAATGATFGLGYEARPGPLAIQLVIFAGAVEIAQLFASHRHARLRDFLVDAVAICAGSIAGSLAKQVRTHWT
jgi:VanZ family protein